MFCNIHPPPMASLSWLFSVLPFQVKSSVVSSRSVTVEARVLSLGSPYAIFRGHWDWFFSGNSRYLAFPPIPVAASSKAWVCGPLACWDCGFESRWRHWMAVSFNHCVCLRWADHSSRGVLPGMVRLSVIVKPRL